MEQLARSYVTSCRICSYILADKRPRQNYGHSREIIGPLRHVVIDYAVSLPPSKEGYKHLIIIMCAFTRYCMILPMKTRESSELLKTFLTSWLPAFQYPEVITSDNELSFLHGDFGTHMKKMGVEFKPLPSYCPQSNGKVEAAVYRAKKALTSFAISLGSRSTWPQYLPLISMGINNFYHSSIKMSPFHALFCFKKSNPLIDVLRMDAVGVKIDRKDPDSFLMERIDRKIIDDYILFNDRKKISQNQKILNKNTIHRNFLVGDKVMRKVFFHSLGPQINRTLMGMYVGPYTVIKVLEYLLFMLDDSSDYVMNLKSIPNISEIPQEYIIKDHKNHCKLYKATSKSLKLPQSVMSDLDLLSKYDKRTVTTRSMS